MKAPREPVAQVSVPDLRAALHVIDSARWLEEVSQNSGHMMDAVPLTPPDVQDATMSFGDHLEELRRRLMLALIAPIPLAIAAFFVSAQLIELLLEPLFRVYAYHDLPLQVHEFAPAEFLMARLKLSIILAVVI